ncbi:MAG: carboxypeptidase regulatory-like domain-containing protein, partial [Planctomycetes bacterium]|nr:carboxypeptidase regulatory-like domain-containing protein [Planctomycetota bacterium]
LMVARGGRYEALAREIAAADGEVRFAALEPGDYVVRCDRDAERELALSAGEHAVVELSLPRGVDVVGRVVDAAGDAVPGADVWLCASLPSWLAGAVVARADATGAFRLRDVPAETSVGALAAGFAPSPLQDLELVDTQDGVKPVRLVLTRGGATLSGLVLDPDGAPVAGARIAVDRHVPYLDMRQNGTRVERWSPRVARTDADGRFRFEGLRAEPLPLEVHAQGYAVVHEELALEELRTLEHVVRLARPVYARGTVRDDAGAPLAGIELRGFDHAQEPDFLGGGQYDHSGVFGYALTRSAADGRYRLGPLAPGEVHLYAQEPQPRSYYGVSLKLDQHHVAATPGEELAWDPVIGPGLALTGRALYADASPLQDIFVSAVDESSGARRSMTTDAEGRFAFYNLDDRTYTLSAQLWDAPPGTQRPTRHGVRPNGEEVVLQVDYVPPREARPGSVVVRVDDAGGRAAARAELGVTLNGARGWQLSQPDEEGVFRFEDVEPGRYRAVLWNGELALGAGEWFELGPGEHVDLGTLVTEPGGDVVLALDRDAAGAALEGVVWLSHADELPQASFAFAAGRDTLRLGNLAPGRWSGRLYGPHVVADTFEVTVVAGTDVDARVAVRAGAVVTCVVSWSGAASPERIVLRATRASDGAVAQEREAVRDPGFLVSPLERALLLVPGAYEVTAEASDGRRAARRVDVAPGEELSTREVRLDLE